MAALHALSYQRYFLSYVHTKNTTLLFGNAGAAAFQTNRNHLPFGSRTLNQCLSAVHALARFGREHAQVGEGRQHDLPHTANAAPATAAYACSGALALCLVRSPSGRLCVPAHA
jgi:hypothetical protein